MEAEELLQRLSGIAAEHFNAPGLSLTRSTVASDVPGWDSITHIQFLMEIEDKLKIRFKSSEVSGFANVGQLVDRILTRLKG